MLSVPEARARVAALMAPVPTETVALEAAGGRVLAAPAVARRAQPPFAASAMDGYAVRAAEAVPGAALRRVGESVAGRRFGGGLGPGETVRIFTGAPMPEGADAVLIQEDAEEADGRVRPRVAAVEGAHIRVAGLDFEAGFTLAPPRRLTPADVALLAAMNVPAPAVRRRPVVALLPTGDELVAPGETPGPDQIISSNTYGLAAMLTAAGAAPRLHPAAADTPEALAAALAAAAEGADLVVTLGDASVGEHDHVRAVVGDDALSFYKIAMRPGKPLMAGRFRGTPMLGLPGNPVSAMICGLLFLLPAVDALLGLPAAAPATEPVRLAGPLPANGPREHYMRARLSPGADGAPRVRVFDDQDSSRLGMLAAATALVVRPVSAPAAEEGEPVPVIRLPD
jgi:molybdopterin molybdotransferase